VQGGKRGRAIIRTPIRVIITARNRVKGHKINLTPQSGNKSTNQHERPITFAANGTAQCLWTEALPLHELGRLKITRAASQQWEVKDRKRKIRFFARSRSACLKWEQQNMQPD
jgi:hypothetical protein